MVPGLTQKMPGLAPRTREQSTQASSVWNVRDASPGFTTMFSGRLPLVSKSAPSSPSYSMRGSKSSSYGYFEVLMFGNSQDLVGLATPLFDVTNSNNYIGRDTQSIGFSPVGQRQLYNGQSSSSSNSNTPPSYTPIGVGYDGSYFYLWVGTTLDFQTPFNPGSPVYPACTIYGTGSIDALINTGQDPFLANPMGLPAWG